MYLLLYLVTYILAWYLPWDCVQQSHGNYHVIIHVLAGETKKVERMCVSTCFEGIHVSRYLHHLMRSGFLILHKYTVLIFLEYPVAIDHRDIARYCRRCSFSQMALNPQRAIRTDHEARLYPKWAGFTSLGLQSALPLTSC